METGYDGVTGTYYAVELFKLVTEAVPFIQPTAGPEDSSPVATWQSQLRSVGISLP